MNSTPSLKFRCQRRGSGKALASWMSAGSSGNFTHVVELLDNDYRYRLFYIGRVSRKKLNEIAERLQQAGVDATCSLNDNKRFFQDTYISH